MTDTHCYDPNFSNTVWKELWVCDVCKIQKFEDYDEACRHEEACQSEQDRSKAINDADTGHPSLDANRADRKRKTNNVDANHKQAHSSNRKIPSIFNVQKKAKSDTNHLASGETKNVKGRKKDNRVPQDVKSNSKKSGINNERDDKDCVLDLMSSSSSENSPTMSTSPIGSVKRKTSGGFDACSKNLIQLVHPADQTKPQNQAKKKTKSTSTTSATTATIAAIFQKDKKKATDTKAFLAEQVAAEFQAKRRLEREREKERQKKRQEAFFKPKNTSKISASAGSTPTQPKVSCPRFPNPSYVYPAASSQLSLPKEREKELLHDETIAQARALIQKSLPFPGREPLQFKDDSETPWPFSLSTTTSPYDDTTADSLDSMSVQNELAKILTITKVSRPLNDTALWVEKYALEPSRVCGEINQKVAKKMESFVREWMVERHKSHQRTAERQKSLKRAAKRKKVKYHDEDLWMDSEDECDSTLPSICLIEGPVGSCKSSLVHAVARLCECPVVELNTSEKRGSANLRKVLEEATLSHSSLDMLKKREANNFNRMELVDSDEESESEEPSGSSLTVILIDEVDNIYESSGDNGFWSALKDLTKKAKCPVFLTANSFPNGLSSSVFRFHHFTTSRPSPIECAQQMKTILEQEDFPIVTELDESKHLKALSSVAELCGCDIRRLIHELQLFACSGSNERTKTTSNAKIITNNSADFPSRSHVTIDYVSPKSVPSNEFVVLTIHGQNFCSLDAYGAPVPVKVFVGKQASPAARVVNETTILAVCPPCYLPSGVDKFGSRRTSKGVRRPSLQTRYAPLSLQFCHPNLSRLESSATRSISLLDDRTISVLSPCNIEYAFPEADDPPSDDEEIEFEEDCHAQLDDWLSNRASCLESRKEFNSSAYQRSDINIVLTAMLTKEWEKVTKEPWANSSTEIRGLQLPADNKVTCNKDQDDLEQLARDCELCSDASVLEGHAGIPFLSGASPGFGYNFTPEEQTRHGNITQCSEERLFSLGWKDTFAFYGDQDSWMVVPSRNEANLVAEASAWRGGTVDALEPTATDNGEEGCNSSEDGLCMWSPTECRVSEEDCCLPRPIPNPLTALPSLLVNTTKSLGAPHLNDCVLRSRLAKQSKALLETMAVLYSPEAQAKLRCSGIFVEHIPMLRSVVAFERATLAMPDDDPPSISQRRTRKSTRKGRCHYFETLNPSYRWGEESCFSAAQVGERLSLVSGMDPF